MSNVVEVATPNIHMTSVERIYKLPVVEQTVDIATSLYGRVKDVNPIVNTVLSTAETTVRGAVGRTMPVANRLGRPIRAVDSILCSSLDFVENKLPIVKLPPEEMYTTTRDYVLRLPGVNCACHYGQQGVRKAVECACAVSEYSTLKLTKLRDTLDAHDIGRPSDASTLLTMYIYTALNALAATSAWVGQDRSETHKKPQANGNGTTAKYTSKKVEEKQNENKEEPEQQQHQDDQQEQQPEQHQEQQHEEYHQQY